MPKLIHLNLLLAASLLLLQASAQKSINLASSSVPFLRIAPDARAGGMGDVGVATLPDANSAFWNIGKLSFAENRGAASVSYIPWLRQLAGDVYLAAAAGYFKPDEDQAISLALRYFNLGSIQFTTDGINNLGGSNPREWGLDLGYSRKLSDRFGLGLTARYIHSALLTNVPATGVNYQTGRAFAADLGLYFDNRSEGNGFTAGAALTNLGTRIAYTKDAEIKDFIPANLALGVSWNTVLEETHAISIALDLNKMLVPTVKQGDGASWDAYRRKTVLESWGNSFGELPGQASASLGIEYWYDQLLAVRAGYYAEARDKGDRRYLTAGIGIRYSQFGFNFSYLIPTGSGIYQNPLSNTLRFSLLFSAQ
jgi:hypothetical protein